jgi:acetyltransferase-like isoleucine patch superfamily enzyme
MKLNFVKSVPFLIFKVLLYAQSKISAIHYRQISNIHPSTKLLPGSKIINVIGLSEAIEIGENTLIAGEVMTFKHGGRVKVGSYCYIGERSKIWSLDQIQIGDRVFISHNVNIHDTNSHPIDAKARHEHFKQILAVGYPSDSIGIYSSPIFIEDDVWIGFNSTILKGVTIGKGSIIGASSVVTKDVPPNTIVAGNPAIIIRKINENEHSKNDREN